MPYVIALDLDGTLLHSDGSVSERTVRAVAARVAQGDRIVIATSRPRRSVLALLPRDFPTDAWICYNGAEVYEGGELLAQELLMADEVRALVELIRSFAPAAMVSVEREDLLYANSPLTYPWPHEVVSQEELTGQPVAKILFDAGSIGDMRGFRARLPDYCSLVLTDDGVLGHLMAKGVTKARGMAHVLDHWRRSFADVVAFGDDLNDCELLAASGLGVAMGNARPEVRAAARKVTATNDEDGVAVMLEGLDADER